MGWLYKFEMTTRKAMIEDRTKVWDTRRFEKKFEYIITTCLKHCYRGNAFRGILWTVRESVTYNAKTDAVIKSDKWIGCDILQYDRKDGCWGYKDMEESSGPSYYSCPLGYLDMVPEREKGYGKKWRVEVRAYHAERKPLFKPKVGDYVILKEGWSRRGPFKITKVKPLIGTDSCSYGHHCKVPRKALLRVVTREELDRAKAEYPKWAEERFGVKAEELDPSKVTDEAIFTINEFLFPE